MSDGESYYRRNVGFLLLSLPLGNLSRLRGEIKTGNVDSLICIDKLGVISFGLYLFYGFFLRSGRP